MRVRVVAASIAIALGSFVLVGCGGTEGDPAVGHSVQQSTSSCDPSAEPACQDAYGDPTPAYCLADGSWSCCDPSTEPKCGSGFPECVGTEWTCKASLGTDSACTTCRRGPAL